MSASRIRASGARMTADFEEPGEEDVIRKLVADLDGKADEATIRAKLVEKMAEAKAQLLEEI